MEKFESKETPPEDEILEKTTPENTKESTNPENTADKKDKEKKPTFITIHEQDAEKARKKIKKLMERNKEIKKELDDLST